MADTDYRFEPRLLDLNLRHFEGRRRRTIAYDTIALSVFCLESLLIMLGSGFGPIVYGTFAKVGQQPPEVSLNIGLAATAIYATVARSRGLYSLPVLLQPGHHIRRILAACVATLLVISWILFLLKVGSTVSRGAVSMFAAAMLLFCALARCIVAYPLSRRMAEGRITGRPVFIIGNSHELNGLSRPFLLMNFGFEAVGRFTIRDAEPQIFSVEFARALDEARACAAREILVAIDCRSAEQLRLIEAGLQATPLPARLLHNSVLRSVIERHVPIAGGTHHLLDLQRAPLGRLELAAKRMLDIAVASVALLSLSPLFAATAFAVKLGSPGPVIFRQRRHGFDRHGFEIWKFRTMTVMENGSAIVQARRGDKRVTKVGRVLRRFSIDELPQLWNVLKGDMSLVGPRPHAIAHDDAYSQIIGDYSRRHHVKPGMTGWAQVHGYRGETARPEQMEARIEYDLWYINNWSLWLDVRILVWTAFEIFRARAY